MKTRPSRLAIAALVAAAAARPLAAEALVPGRVSLPGQGPLPTAQVIDFDVFRPPPEPRATAAGVAGLGPAAPGDRRGLFARLFGPRAAPRPTRRPPLHTKYPVVLIHGANNPKLTKLGPVTLRYFAKTEAHLRALDLRVLVPAVDPFGSIEDRAASLKAQIMGAIPTGKFNLVGHSMGGLDARFLASRDPIGARVASVTTVSTPHHGAWYADFADKWLFKRQGLNKLGSLIGMRFDQIPDLKVDFIQREFNPATPDRPGVGYFSYGTATSPFKSPLFFWGMNFITRIAEKRAASRGRAFGGGVPLGLRAARGRIDIGRDEAAAVAASSTAPAGWVIPKWAGRNDGVVSLSSSVWGKYLGTVKTHHWGPMGWLSRFPEEKFWEGVVRRLIADGY